ncbi:hypothetical protein DCO48_13530 [Pseudomonas sp. SDI]|uniref:hypothetical protein n=1 Tax=Pseudomonas sp. SDI TaxID=2170734 RepID=UPI000DE679CB|nr:hypothetical protein [Pseudomonas sp. SDI]PWB32355.1 hypothetical protein DCO48_13530 [Pseudomonas sp. SDI]
MVTDKLTLDLLSRLANAQLALATSMKGVVASNRDYPQTSLQGIADALDVIESLLLDIGTLSDESGLALDPKLH